jgi:hypothetical protein
MVVLRVQMKNSRLARNDRRSQFQSRVFLDLPDACLYKNALTTVKTVAPTAKTNNKKNCYTLIKSGFGRFLFPTHRQGGTHA